MRMVFTRHAAGQFVGVSERTIRDWAYAGLIPFGIRPLQDGRYVFHRSDLEYARDVVKPTRQNIGTRPAITRRPAGILAGGRRR